MGSMVSCWWDSVSQANSVALLVVAFFSWLFGMVSRKGNLDKEMLGESVLLGCVSVRSIVGTIEVSR